MLARKNLRSYIHSDQIVLISDFATETTYETSLPELSPSSSRTLRAS